MMSRGLPTRRFLLVGLSAAMLAGCSQRPRTTSRAVDSKYGVSASRRVIADGQPIPKGGGSYRVGRPYTIAGVRYVPREDPDYDETGIASWYGDDFHGRLTANGEVYDMHGLSAAHTTLPMPSYVRVTSVETGRSLIVRVNDRGPFHDNREIDLSARAADLLGFRGRGLARVRVQYVGRASLAGSDDRLLASTLSEGSPATLPSSLRVASADTQALVTGSINASRDREAFGSDEWMSRSEDGDPMP
jgi:rare lipoprotein A